MKQVLFIASVFWVVFATGAVAQRADRHGEWGKMSGKIEQLENIKLIEELNLDEETAIKFFARRHTHRKEMRLLIQKKDSLYKKIKKGIEFDDKVSFNKMTKEIFNIEKKMLEDREVFLNSLNDILTEKQMVQLVLFEYFFRKEIRSQFMKQGKRRKMEH